MLQTTQNAKRGQVNTDAAQIYGQLFVPAVFSDWAAPVCDAARIGPGDHVLDVACGTGAAALEAARRVGDEGSIVGLDPNEGMLAFANRAAPHISWRAGIAESLPFPEATFTAVLCQFGLMFFDDRRAGLSEMVRVLRPGGRAVATVWHPLETSTAYSKMVPLLDRIVGREAGDALRAPFALGDGDALRALLDDGGWDRATLSTREGSAHFTSMAEWVHVTVRGWAFSDLVSADEEAALLDVATVELAHVIRPDGSVAFPTFAHIIVFERT